MNKWELKWELVELCVKCAGLKPSTAKSYARKFYAKHEENGDSCVSWHSDKQWKEKCNDYDNLTKALNTLKNGIITSDAFVLKLEDVSHVDFKENAIEITTKNGKAIKFGKGFEYLEYVFKYNNRHL